MSAVGIIAREARTSNLNTSVSAAANNILTVEEVDAMTTVEGTDFEDFELLSEAWNLTFESRDEMLKTQLSTSDYMNKFPFLSQPLGYELVRTFLSWEFFSILLF
jgi:hypothetical protein